MVLLYLRLSIRPKESIVRDEASIHLRLSCCSWSSIGIAYIPFLFFILRRTWLAATSTHLIPCSDLSIRVGVRLRHVATSAREVKVWILRALHGERCFELRVLVSSVLSSTCQILVENHTTRVATIEHVVATQRSCIALVPHSHILHLVRSKTLVWVLKSYILTGQSLVIELPETLTLELIRVLPIILIILWVIKYKRLDSLIGIIGINMLKVPWKVKTLHVIC